MRVRHTVWFEEKTWERILRLTSSTSKKTKRPVCVSDIINSACEEFKRVEIETLQEKKKALAREHACIAQQIAMLDDTIQAAVEAREREKEQILETALRVKP